MMDRVVRRIGLVGLALLITASFLDSPQWWLLIPGWSCIGWHAFVWYQELPKGSSRQTGLGLLCLVLIFGSPAWEPMIDPLGSLLTHPTRGHFWSVIYHRIFLFWIVAFLVGTCVGLSNQRDALRQDLGRLRNMRS